MPSVSVVLATYSERRWPHLQAAVRSVQAQSRPAAEIIIVVDHNPALARTARRTFPGVTVLENPGPRGESAARSTGSRAATGEIVAFMDDDAEASPDWLELLLVAYADPKVVAVGGSIDPAWASEPPAWFPTEFLWVVGCSYRGLPEAAAPVRNLIGCNMSFRRRALLAAGGFRNGVGRVGTMPLACAETELCIRLSQLDPGAGIAYEPAARVRHHVPADRACWSYFVRRCWSEGLGKALVAASTGSGPALASERTYVVRTLRAGVARGLRRALAGDATGMRSAAAIVAGLAVTTAGYLHARVQAPVPAPGRPAESTP